jgi:serine/threonine protein kinase
MPYEQYMGQAGPSSDLYSLAATFLHLLTGRPPSAFMTEAGRIEVPASLPGDPRLAPIIARLLRPSPAERYASAREVRLALLSPTALQGITTAVKATAQTSPVAVALGPVPRAIEGDIAELLEHLAPSALELMDASRKPSDDVGFMDWATLVLTSTITLGSLPLTFMFIARQRRRRLRRFLRDGIPATAEIIRLLEEPMAFEVKMAKVFYEFHADGEAHRDADRIMPVVANRWRVGDNIQILYLPDQRYDSLIVSG